MYGFRLFYRTEPESWADISVLRVFSFIRPTSRLSNLMVQNSLPTLR